MATETSPYSAKTPEEYLRTRVDFKTDAYRSLGLTARLFVGAGVVPAG